MEIVIRKLSPALADDYVRFFDTTPHSDNVEEHRCYCVCWCGEDCEGKDFSTPEKRRAYALQSIHAGTMQGYLAYEGDAVVGWCNANAKADCLQCYSWRRFMGAVPVDSEANPPKIKSIFCFAISPAHRRSGIATRLLARVCADAAADGFDVAEAYPNQTFVDTGRAFMGPAALFEKHGFTPCFESGEQLVLRKPLR
jgi:ribosomal protein S18 acetylase RimI-like enzyme